jgi:hypothetical protein
MLWKVACSLVNSTIIYYYLLIKLNCRQTFIVHIKYELFTFSNYEFVTLNNIYIFLLNYLLIHFMDILTTPAYRTISNHVIAEVRQKIANEQNALFALRPYHPGEVIAEFSAGTISAEPTYLTVQVGIARHITLQPEFLQYINHSCDPNVFFDTTTMQLVALKELQPQQEMTFFYPSTEWEMTQSFNCYCGSHHCLGKIQGAAFLSKQAQEQYRFTDFIQQQLAKKSANKKVA